jgi:ABC-type branched-subunit amino acid transport system ATPase component
MTTASARPPQSSQGAVLQTTGLSVGYSGIAVAAGLDIQIRRGEVVALMGRNGAGKTTLLHTVAGLIPPVHGSVRINGSRPSPAFHRRVRGGLALVTEQRAIIRKLTVAQNLRLAGVVPADVYGHFPELSSLKNRHAGLLSGGEQQMLALGRAIAAKPSLLLIDELSLGLAPLVVERLLAGVRRAASDQGCGVLLVEQQATTALRVADRGYMISAGALAMTGTAAELRSRRDEIERLYLLG